MIRGPTLTPGRTATGVTVAVLVIGAVLLFALHPWVAIAWLVSTALMTGISA